MNAIAATGYDDASLALTRQNCNAHFWTSLLSSLEPSANPIKGISFHFLPNPVTLQISVAGKADAVLGVSGPSRSAFVELSAYSRVSGRQCARAQFASLSTHYDARAVIAKISRGQMS
jgi:hypothetical protein